MNVRFLVSVVLALMVAAAGWSGGSSEAGEGAAGGAAGATAAGPSRFAESPMLAALVAAGELPPVDERLPLEPVVRPVLAEIGTHGGTLFVSAAGQSYLQDMGFWGEAGVPYVGKNPDGSLYPSGRSRTTTRARSSTCVRGYAGRMASRSPWKTSSSPTRTCAFIRTCRGRGAIRYPASRGWRSGRCVSIWGSRFPRWRSG